MSKWLKTCLLLTVASLAISGCSLVKKDSGKETDAGETKAQETQVGGLEEKTVKDVVGAYLADKGNENHTIRMEITDSVKLAAEGEEMDVSMSISIGGEFLDKEHAFASVKSSTSLYGMEDDTDLSMYRDGNKFYTCDADEQVWYVTDEESFENTPFECVSLSLDSFRNAVIDYDSKAKAYTITQPYTDFVGAGVLGEFADMSGSMVEMFGGDAAAFDRLFGETCVTYTFDADCRLVGIHMDDVHYSEQMDMGGTMMDVALDMTLDIQYSGYGSVTAEKAAVPADIAESAVDDIYSMGNEFHFSTGTDEPDDEFGGHDDDEPFTQEAIGVEEDPEESFGEAPVIGYGLLGTYNGVDLTCQGDSFADTFGADGWTIADEGNEYGYISLSNPRYGTWSYVNLFMADRSDASREKLESDGFSGYAINIEDSDTYPSMYWNGITFGATAADVLRVYGKPYSVYEGELLASYTYHVAVGSDKIADLTFYLDADAGLEQVVAEVYAQ